LGGDRAQGPRRARRRQPVLKEIRDKTGETACFFKVEQNYRVCVAVAETHHALRRDMYVGKVIPLHVGSASRILLAWNPELAERILAAPLEPMTDFTVTSPDELRALIAQAMADGYAITASEREDSASGLSAPVFDAAGDILGAITISGPTIRMPITLGRSATISRNDRIKEILRGCLHSPRKKVTHMASSVPEELSAPPLVQCLRRLPHRHSVMPRADDEASV